MTKSLDGPMQCNGIAVYLSNRWAHSEGDKLGGSTTQQLAVDTSGNTTSSAGRSAGLGMQIGRLGITERYNASYKVARNGIQPGDPYTTANSGIPGLPPAISIGVGGQRYGGCGCQ